MEQLRVELGRYRADLAAARRERFSALRHLAAIAGGPDLPDGTLAGRLDAPLPDYDFDAARERVVSVHAEFRSAHFGVDRARLLARRAEVEPIPNITVGAGYMRQSQNRSDDWALSVSAPVPVWNRTQGNVRTAQAQLGDAIQQVRRAELDLTARLATAYGNYTAARERAERYRDGVLPNAREAHRMSLGRFQGGQFDYLRVLQSQRAVAEANLEYVRALGDAWRAASEIAGMLLEEAWPASSPEPSAVKPN